MPRTPQGVEVRQGTTMMPEQAAAQLEYETTLARIREGHDPKTGALTAPSKKKKYDALPLYYVYEHWCDNQCIGVGYGSGKRAYDMSDRPYTKPSPREMPYPIRFPAAGGMRDALEEQARVEGRSLHRHILRILQQHLGAEEMT